tara:strand:- start:6949 stop:7365 length:417 start_codon:yes stop_codon:yes gene_type:complete
MVNKFDPPMDGIRRDIALKSSNAYFNKPEHVYDPKFFAKTPDTREQAGILSRRSPQSIIDVANLRSKLMTRQRRKERIEKKKLKGKLKPSDLNVTRTEDYIYWLDIYSRSENGDALERISASMIFNPNPNTEKKNLYD